MSRVSSFLTASERLLWFQCVYMTHCVYFKGFILAERKLPNMQNVSECMQNVSIFGVKAHLGRFVGPIFKKGDDGLTIKR